MLDVGWSEILVIAIVMIVVVGPKDLPKMLRAFGKATARMRSTANEFRQQFNEALKEAELDDVKNIIDEARSLNPKSKLTQVFDPIRSAGEDLRTSLKNTDEQLQSSMANQVTPTDAAKADEKPVPAAEPITAPAPVEATAPVTSRAKKSATPKATSTSAKVAAKPADKSKAKSASKTAATKSAETKTATKPVAKKNEKTGTKA